MNTEYNDENVKSLVTEMHIMKLIGKHENIVTLLKCSQLRGEFLVIMEYVGNGCLSSFLQQCYKGNNFNPLGGYNEETASLKFCYQIARGMEYLASKKVRISVVYTFPASLKIRFTSVRYVLSFYYPSSYIVIWLLEIFSSVMIM